MRITKSIEDQTRTAFNECECSEILLADYMSMASSKQSEFLQKFRNLIGLYKTRVKKLEDHVIELENKVKELEKK